MIFGKYVEILEIDFWKICGISYKKRGVFFCRLVMQKEASFYIDEFVLE
jgi:hypothetical protein